MGTQRHDFVTARIVTRKEYYCRVCEDWVDEFSTYPCEICKKRFCDRQDDTNVGVVDKDGVFICDKCEERWPSD